MTEGRAPGVSVTVGPIPAWLPREALLGPGPWTETTTEDGLVAAARLDRRVAADVAARLRGLGFGGHPVVVTVVPPLSRDHVRDARAVDARRRRDTTPGFTRPGAQLDDEGRWSLTPEALALSLGRRFSGKAVVDLGCGCGGNSIGFARGGASVIAVEPDPARAAMTRHNARLYGVGDKVKVIAGDDRSLSMLHGDVLFIDPPWGTDWDRLRTPLLTTPLLAPALAAHDRFATVVAKLPPSVDTREAPEAKAEAWFGVAEGDRQRVKFVTLTWG
jgi:hypothetical protein